MGKRRKTVLLLSAFFIIVIISTIYTVIYRLENVVEVYWKTKSSVYPWISSYHHGNGTFSTAANNISQESSTNLALFDRSWIQDTHSSFHYTTAQQKSVIPYIDKTEELEIDKREKYIAETSLNLTVKESGRHIFEQSSILLEKFTFPQPIAIKPKELIVKTKWFTQLRNFLINWPDQYFLIVSSNSAYKEVLLNWLVSAVCNAQVPINNILVVAFDEEVHLLLERRGIKSIFIPFEDILSVTLVNQAPTFTKIMMTRLAVVRLISHWGFDIAHFDTDAIVLRNPLSLFRFHQGSDIIGSSGMFPKKLMKEWGITICAGMVMFRHTQQTETYWKEVSKFHLQSFSDQERLNSGLKLLHVQWNPFDRSQVKRLHSPIEGVCNNGLHITLLPQSVVCRDTCNSANRSSYTVWHAGTAKDGMSKKRKASAGHVWFLDQNWDERCKKAHLIKNEWLKCISTS